MILELQEGGRLAPDIVIRGESVTRYIERELVTSGSLPKIFTASTVTVPGRWMFVLMQTKK